MDNALFTPGYTAAIIGHEREALDKIFEIVKRAFDNLPDCIKPKANRDTLRMLQFETNFLGEKMDSSIYVAMKLRSGTVQSLHVTESAYNKDRQELNAGSKQAVPLSGRIVEETTTNGFDSFYDFFMDNFARQHNLGPTDYKCFFFPWWMNEEYTLPGTMPEILPDDKIKYGDEMQERQLYSLSDGQLLWRRWKIDELRNARSQFAAGLNGLQLFKQEYPSNLTEAFQSGVGAVFDPDALAKITPKRPLSTLEVPPEDEKGLAFVRKGIAIWKRPETGREYVVGCDPSDGEGADFSCIDIQDRETGEEVAQFYGKVRPDDLAQLNADLGYYYNHAVVGVENNMLTTILLLSKIYDNYYSEVVIDEKTKRQTKKIGWNTNSKTRDVMIDDFVIAFEEGNITINSPITNSEMRTFVKKENGKREHADGKHDDALIAAMIAHQMRRYKKPEARGFTNKPSAF